MDNSQLGVAQRLRTSAIGGPIAAKTRLGWVVYGRQARSVGARLLHCAAADTSDDRVEKIVREFYSTENFGVRLAERRIESDEDTRARAILESTTVRIGNRFQTGLLWRADDTSLPDSYAMALQRLKQVESKMRRDQMYADLYTRQIADYVSKGYARVLTADEAAVRNGRTWYLPHFGVQSAHKPGKLRVVFDAAASVNGTSLNDVLIKGPDMNRLLISIMYQFRMRAIGVCADIAEMFLQVSIQPSDRSAQRFLWRTDVNRQPDTYEMCVMTFGATCSPTSAQYVKNINASQFEREHPMAAEAIRSSHYVDDFVASFDNEDDAVDVTKNIVAIHKRGGFVLRSFVSNSTAVLGRLGVDDVNNQQINMQLEPNATDKILGLRWCTATDDFVFTMRFDRVDGEVMAGIRRPTKREMLSVSMSVYDPFGFLADYMLHAKLMIQHLWRTGTGWDELVPENIGRTWQLWCADFERVKLLRIPRCFSTALMVSTNVQLHVFADASEQAFSAVAYWRIEHEGRCEVAFVTGKTRCAPVKRLSVPRLELQAAILAVRVHHCLRDCIGVNVTKTVMWTDSTTVLRWIRSTQRRYQQFVAHRIGEILEETNADWWRWVPTRENVADDGTRFTDRPQFDAASRWLRGPAFLLGDESCWPTATTSAADGPTDLLPEEIPNRFVGVLVAGDTIAFTRFSQMNRIVRMFGWLLRFVHNAQSTKKGHTKMRGELDAAELRRATMAICRVVQAEGFPAEFDALENGRTIERCSNIRALLPYLGDGNVMRLYGRTDAADTQHLSTDAQRPILLPRNHHFTELVAKHHHAIMGHQQEDATICSIRQMFWVPELRRLVRSVKQRCPSCRFRAAQPHPAVAGQIPVDRLTPHVHAFTYTGLDYFGPVGVSVGRRHEKRWIALFTCMTTRAIHLEVASDLSTDSCLVAIRNFINLRGVPVRIRSDCGTNFVGADNELRRTEDFLDMATIQRDLATRGIQWLFNCPGNPEAGGAWERLVQSTKRVLAVTLKSISPKVETLRSYIIEAANIINSRPLTHVPISPADMEPITPNHFLIGRANSTTTPGPIDLRQLCQSKQWRICLQLRNHFWSRWIKEYLPELTRRSKFYADVGPIKEGDLVLVCDSNVSRANWTRGRIVRAFRGTDGKIRTAEVKTSSGSVRRPVTKLAILDIEDDEPPFEQRSHGARDVGE